MCVLHCLQGRAFVVPRALRVHLVQQLTVQLGLGGGRSGSAWSGQTSPGSFKPPVPDWPAAARQAWQARSLTAAMPTAQHCAAHAQVRQTHPDLTIILYISGSGGLLERMAAVRPDVVSIDQRVDMRDAIRRIGPDFAVQARALALGLLWAADVGMLEGTRGLAWGCGRLASRRKHKQLLLPAPGPQGCRCILAPPPARAADCCLPCRATWTRACCSARGRRWSSA